jgi:glucosamine-6-phosphate deaminase
MASPSSPIRTFQVDRLQVKIFADRDAMGAAAAQAVGQHMRATIEQDGSVAVVFAAAPSQNELLASLAALPDIHWDSVVAFHLDEYIGLPKDAPQGFGNFLREHLFDLVEPGTVYYLDGQAADPEDECRRYASLLEEHDVDIVCAGIGENGHLAFNDPPTADFSDPRLVKVVELEDACRRQQVHDGCFEALDAVPTHALTLTIPALMAAEQIHTVVPGPTKTEAVERTLEGPIGTECPATALRGHSHAILYLDRESAASV